MTGRSFDKVNVFGNDSPLYEKLFNFSFNSLAPCSRSALLGLAAKERYIFLRIESSLPGRLYMTQATWPRRDLRNGLMTPLVCLAARALRMGVQKSQTPAGSGVFQPWPS